jgi:hypothetical protein
MTKKDRAIRNKLQRAFEKNRIRCVSKVPVGDNKRGKQRLDNWTNFKTVRLTASII